VTFNQLLYLYMSMIQQHSIKNNVIVILKLLMF